MQYINFSAVNRLQPDFSSPSFSIKYVLYFLYFAEREIRGLISRWEKTRTSPAGHWKWRSHGVPDRAFCHPDPALR